MDQTNLHKRWTAAKLQKVLNRLTNRLDRRFIVFSIFIVISTIFWFLIKLEEEYQSDIRFPVRFTNFPENKVLVGDVPREVQLEVRSRGYKLLEYKLNNIILPLVIDLNAYPLKLDSRDDNGGLFLLTRDLRYVIEKQLSTEVEVVEIEPDTLFFEFASRIRKQVQVVPNIKIEPAKQFMKTSGINIDPDSIFISGPSNILDTIIVIKTQEKAFTNLSENLDEEIALEELENVKYSRNTVRIQQQIKEYTEAQVSIPIEPLNVPDSLILRPFPEAVNLKCFVALDDYEKVIPAAFNAVIDYTTISNESDQLKIKLTESPSFARQIRLTPEYCDYIIEKR